MLQPPGPSLSFKSNFPESLKLYGPNDPAEVLLYRKTRRGRNETLLQGYDTAGPSTRRLALMLGINLKHCTVFMIRWIMFLIMALATLELSLPRRLVSPSGELQKVAGLMNGSQQRLLFSILRDPGRGMTTIKTLKKKRATENKWEQFVSSKVFLTLIYSRHFLLLWVFIIIFICSFWLASYHLCLLTFLCFCSRIILASIIVKFS